MTTETKHTAGPWAVLQEECDNPYIRVRAALEMADAEIARLKDRVAELERDAARLDWIANSANSVDRPIEEGRGPWMLWPRYGTLRATRGKTLREAIDKAMGAWK